MTSLLSDEISSDEVFLPFKSSHGFIVWSLVDAILGAHGALTLLSRSDFTFRHQLFRDRVRVTAAAFFLCLGFWSSQLIELRGTALFFQWSPSLNPGFVVLSFFVLFTVILLVISLFSFVRRPHCMVKHVICGILCGCAAFFSNYALCLSINDVRLRIAPAQYSLSVLLGVSMSLFSFIGFTILLSKKKYCFCGQHILSFIFGTSVVGANLLAQEGTTLGFYPQDVTPHDPYRSGSAMIAISSVATLVLACLCLYLYETGNQNTACEKVRVPKLSITSVSFASDGRVLVNEDGTLPSREIDLVGPLLDYRRDLQPHGDIFQWLFSLSFDWNIVQPFVPFKQGDPSRRKIRDVLDSLLSVFKSHTGTESSPRASFKLRVLEAITSLAADLEIPLSEIGYLYDLTLTTGDYLNVSEFLLLCERDSTQFYDAEKALRRPDGSMETGLMLFFIRNLPESVPLTDLLLKYARKDYKLAFMRHVRNSLIDSVAATPDKVDQVLVGCREYMTRGTKVTLEPGKTYLSLHAERNARNGTREILVYDFAKHQIPSFILDIPEMTDGIRSWIANSAGLSAEDLQALCRSEIKKRRSIARHSGTSFTSIRSQTHSMFEYALANALQDLSSNLFFLPDMLDTARLSPEVVEVLLDDGPPAYMITLQMEILDGPDDDMSISSRVDLFPTSILSKPIIPFTFTFAPKSLHELSGSLVAGMPIDLQYTLCAELQRLLRSCGVIVNHSDLARMGSSPFPAGLPLVSSFSLDTISLESTESVDQLPSEKPAVNLVAFVSSTFKKTFNRARITPKPSGGGMVEILPRPPPALLAPDRTPVTGPPINVLYCAELEQHTTPGIGSASEAGLSKHPYLHLRLPSPLLVANPLLYRPSNMVSDITSATN